MNKQSELSILPITKEGTPDQRFIASANRILDAVGTEVFEELSHFAQETESIQRRAAKAGLRLAVAIFKEALYLEKEHRFDADNQYGWRSKCLRKQAQHILENIGFKQKNAHKLVTCASWLTAGSFDKSEREWLDGLSPSHIYELSRMSGEGYALVKVEVSYPEFHFSAGQKEISVRRLEELRRLYPKGGIFTSGETKKVSGQMVNTSEYSSHHYEHELLDTVPGIDDAQVAIPMTNPVDEGIQMLITSLGMIGSLDELSMAPDYLGKLKPYSITLQILSDMLQQITSRI